MKKSTNTSKKIYTTSSVARRKKVENGARDFAVRFESVMRDLAKG